MTWILTLFTATIMAWSLDVHIALPTPEEVNPDINGENAVHDYYRDVFDRDKGDSEGDNNSEPDDKGGNDYD